MLFPRTLKKGDKVAIIAPAGKLKANDLDSAISEIEGWGLEVQLGANVFKHNGHFSGTDAERLSDLQNAINDPSIVAIISARGGYGLTRIVEKIDYSRLQNNPKWIVGYSDLTAIQLRLFNLGIASIHGPMGTSFGKGGSENSIRALKDILFNGSSKVNSNKPNGRVGMNSGQLTGGNLSLVVDSLGTPNEIDTDNKILVLEEVGELTYRVDRMLYQLLRAGKLNNLAGLVIGHFTDIEDGETSFAESWQKALERVIKDFYYPVAYGFEIGHEPDNMPVVMGAEYNLKVSATGASLSIITKLD